MGMTENEMMILKAIANDDYSVISALRDRDFVALSVATDSLISEKLVIQEEGQLFLTANGVRMAWA